MKRVLLIAVLLAGTSSCLGLKRDPPFPPGTTVTNQPAPPSPVYWSGGQSNQVVKADVPDNSTNAQLSQYAMSSPQAPVADSTAGYAPGPVAQHISSPYAPTMPPPGTDPTDGMQAYATGQGSGYGLLPPPSPMPLPPPAAIPGATAGPGAPAPAADTAVKATAPPPPPGPPMAAAPAPEDVPGVQQTSFTDRQPALPTIINGSSKTAAVVPAPSAVPLAQTTAVPPLPQTVNLLPSQPADADAAAVPFTPIYRVVNSKRITLHYELRDGGGTGVTGVDLFGTRDWRTWKKIEASHPTPNSYVVEVKDEGWYGFTMVARAGTTPAAPPKAGDPPQVQVTVDTTKPLVQLNGVELSLTAKTPALVVRWTAQDRNFNKRPITISYAETIEGPWVPLARNVENTGRLEIPLTPAIPHAMLLRVEAVDAAENMGLAQTQAALQLNLPWITASGAQEAGMPRLLPAPPAVAPNPTARLVDVDTN